MDKNPLVSIIMPTYNQEDFIGEAIESVQRQTLEDWELIIINNYSNDRTLNVIAGFNDKRIIVYNFSNNGVIASSRNLGLRSANGEYIAFLDSDDLWVPDKLERQVKFLSSDKSALLCSSNCDQFPIGQRNVLKKFKSGYITPNALLKRNEIINSSVLMKRSVIEKVGFIDESPGLKAVEDYDYWIRIAFKFKKSLFLMKNVLVLYRLHGANTTGSGEEAIIRKYDKLFLMLNKNKSLLGDKANTTQKYYRICKKEEIERVNFYDNHNYIRLCKSDITTGSKLAIIFKSYIRKLWSAG